MAADAAGLSMPAVVTLNDLAAMNAADTNGHRYETTRSAWWLGRRRSAAPAERARTV